MASHLRRWCVHTLTDHLVSSFQARFFIMGNKHGAVRALRFREDWVKEFATFLSWEKSYPPAKHSCSQGQVVGHLSLPGTERPGWLQLSQVVIFSSAPGGQLFFQELGQASSVLLVWMNVYFLSLWCRTSLPFNFLSVLVVRGGAVCLPTPPSWFSPIPHVLLHLTLSIYHREGRAARVSEANFPLVNFTTWITSEKCQLW